MKKIQLVLFITLVIISFVISQTKKTTRDLHIGFEKDNYTVVRTVNYNGQRGILAAHKFVRVRSTNQPKKVLYVEGNGYEMGYLTGLLTKNEIEQMATSYIKYLPPQLINYDYVEKHRNETWFQLLLSVIERTLISKAYQS